MAQSETLLTTTGDSGNTEPVNLGAGAYFKTVVDTATNDSDKTLTVPANKIWHIYAVYADLATTATAGNRQMELHVGDGSNTWGRFPAGATQAESTTEYYMWGAAGDSLETVAANHYLPAPSPAVLPPAWTVRIYDSAAVDAAADDLVIRMLVVEYDAT